MKSLIQTLFFFLLVTQIGFAQWYQQNPLLQQNTLNDVVLIDGNNGWAVGENGMIIKTTNGGIDWSTQESGTINSLHGVCFADLNNGWAVGNSGTILRTTNGGTIWTPQTSGTSDELNDISFVNTSTGVAVGENGTILRTTDTGITWTYQTGGGSLSLKDVCFIDSNTGWVVGDSASSGGGNDGVILKTTNGGITWTEQSLGTTYGWEFLNGVHFTDANKGWAVGLKYINPWEGLILTTTNGGSTWTEPAGGIGYSLEDVYFTDVSNGWLVSSGTETGGSGTILKTTDGGVNWIQQASGTSQGLRAVSFNNSNTGVVVGGNGTIKYTSNGGSIWASPPGGETNNWTDVYFFDANNGIVVGDAGSILKTDNGGNSWTSIPSGTMKDFSAICFTDANNGWAVTGDYWDDYHPFDTSIVLYTPDGGTTWTTQLKVPSSKLYSVSFLDIRTGFVVGGGRDSSGYLYSIFLRTTNGGLTWDQQIIDTMITLSKIHFVNVNNGWMIEGLHYYENSKIDRTTDGGMSWYQQLVTPSNDDYLLDIAFSDLNNGIAVGDNNFFWAHRGLITRTTDGGENWSSQYVSGPGECPDLIFWDVFFVTDDIAVVLGNLDWCSGEIMFYWTTDGGTTWAFRPSGLDFRMNRLFFTDELTGWVIGNNGIILHTTNGGIPVELTSFTAIANGKEVILNWSTATELNNQGFEIQRSTEGKEFFTIGFVNGHGTTTEQHNYSFADRNLDDGNYYYRLKQVDYEGSYEYSDVVEVEWRAFNSYLLEQNYPNPFNPSTTIGFGMQNKSNVKITILNVIGEEVAVVFNEEREAGFHQVEFNAANLPSGVYFYQLRAGEFVQTKKMLLLK